MNSSGSMALQQNESKINEESTSQDCTPTTDIQNEGIYGKCLHCKQTLFCGYIFLCGECDYGVCQETCVSSCSKCIVSQCKHCMQICEKCSANLCYGCVNSGCLCKEDLQDDNKSSFWGNQTKVKLTNDCPVCGVILRVNHVHFCEWCGRDICYESCTKQCSKCSSIHCKDCVKICKKCDMDICWDCASEFCATLCHDCELLNVK